MDGAGRSAGTPPGARPGERGVTWEARAVSLAGLGLPHTLHADSALRQAEPRGSNHGLGLFPGIIQGRCGNAVSLRFFTIIRTRERQAQRRLR